MVCVNLYTPGEQYAVYGMPPAVYGSIYAICMYMVSSESSPP